MVPFAARSGTDRKQVCKGAESREIRVHSEKPVRHPSGGATRASEHTSLKFRGKLKGKVDVWGRPLIDGS